MTQCPHASSDKKQKQKTKKQTNKTRDTILTSERSLVQSKKKPQIPFGKPSGIKSATSYLLWWPLVGKGAAENSFVTLKQGQDHRRTTSTGKRLGYASALPIFPIWTEKRDGLKEESKTAFMSTVNGHAWIEMVTPAISHLQYSLRIPYWHLATIGDLSTCHDGGTFSHTLAHVMTTRSIVGQQPSGSPPKVTNHTRGYIPGNWRTLQNAFTNQKKFSCFLYSSSEDYHSLDKWKPTQTILVSKVTLGFRNLFNPTHGWINSLPPEVFENIVICEFGELSL